MTLLVTGANGFVGRHVVAAALEAGHPVRALIRPHASAAGLGTLVGDPRLEVVRADLRSPAGLEEITAGVDVAVHLAAAKAGDFATQFAGTVVATENLLTALAAADVRALVAVSTFSVYDYRRLRSGSLLDETAPVDRTPAKRDEYARTKLLQERLYRQFGSTDGRRMLVVRPSMVYGRGELWHPLLGAELGPLFLRVDRRAPMPLTYVENTAEALVLAAEYVSQASSPLTVDGEPEVVNLVDDDLPTVGRYVELVREVVEPPRTVRLPWPVLRAAAAGLEVANRTLVGGRAKLPGIAVPDRLDARFKPLRYTNAKATRLLGWQPRYDVTEAIARSGPAPEPNPDPEHVGAVGLAGDAERAGPAEHAGTTEPAASVGEAGTPAPRASIELPPPARPVSRR